MRILISDAVRAYLADDSGDYTRRDRRAVERALAELALEAETDFAQFYLEYQGPFIGRRSTPDLDELVDFGSSIMSTLDYFNERYDLGRQFVPLVSDESEGSFLYDVRTGRVYDFRLAEYEQFKSGRVEPRWASFGEFLDWFFAVSGG